MYINKLKIVFAVCFLASITLPMQANANGFLNGLGGSSSNSKAISAAAALSASGSIAVGEGGQGGTTAINIDSRNKRSAPAIFAGNIPTTIHSCRLYMFGGGSSPNGAVTGSIPLGNDQTCLSVVAVGLMKASGSFTQLEVDTMICKIEGMDELPTCKDLMQ